MEETSAVEITERSKVTLLFITLITQILVGFN